MKTQTILKLGIAFLFAISFTSCEEITDIIENEIIIDGDITESITWKEDNTYIIDGSVSIDGVTLTIEPGTIVMFKEGAQIEIGYYKANSTLIAEGTSDRPITFSSYPSASSAGDWDFIAFYSGATTNCSLNHCVIEYGGGYGDSYGAIHLSDCEVSIKNTTIKDSENYGISLDSDSKFSSFTGNTITSVGSYPVSLYPNAAHTIGTNNTIASSSEVYGILVKSGTYNLANETWLKQDVQYVIDGALEIDNVAGTILNIEAGTTIAFTQGSQIELAYYNYGTIKAVGTASNPITFTSAAASKTKGDWDAILIYNGASDKTIFDYCNFEYGGDYGDGYGAVHMSESKITLKNSSITNSKHYGITLDSDASFVEFNNNIFTDCGNFPVSIYGNYVHTLGKGNTFNSTLGIKVKGDDYVQENETWNNLSASYYIDGALEIGTTAGAILNIEEGTTIKFTNGSQIEVGYYSSGKLVAQGTASNPITFTTASPSGSESNGDWDAILIYGNVMDGTQFNNCKILYGGGYSDGYGCIYLSDTDSKVVITNTEIAYSAGWALSYSGTNNPTLTNNNFHHNTSGDIKP